MGIGEYELEYLGYMAELLRKDTRDGDMKRGEKTRQANYYSICCVQSNSVKCINQVPNAKRP